jgi:REP element-mobilizing transposase RayT
MPRQARLDAQGTIHHVIVRGIEKRQIFNDREDRENFVSRMGLIASETETPIYAWSLMTNHAHILLRSGPHGLSKFMRRLLTGYAISYNRRHNRTGHLFQNRYKSTVCDEDSYFQELVRYIHLNPLRAKLVANMSALDRYPWSGHAAVMGRVKSSWQDWDYVLSWFGNNVETAKKTYLQYVQKGIAQGRRPDLIGGGLIRSLGGWSEVLSLRRQDEQVLADERILGSGDFVERILKEADDKLKHELAANKRRHDAERFIEQVCAKEKINSNELRMGSRRGRISQVRSKIACQLVEDYGLPLAEIARKLGVSTSAVSKALTRAARE